MPQYRDRLPQLDADLFLTDGGIETTLIFDDGLDLPDFAAFTLLADEEGRAALRALLRPLRRHRPTRRGRHRAGDADLAGQPGLGRSARATTPTDLAAVNRDAVDLLVRASGARSSTPARRSSSAAASVRAATATARTR